MKHEEALRKALLLLKLAERGGTPAESALAAAKAQEIIDRYKLDVTGLDYEAETAQADNEPIQNFSDQDPLETTNRVTRKWSVRLASSVARANQCRIYYANLNNRWRISIVGRPSDVSAVRYIYSYLKNEVLRLQDLNTKGNSGTYRYHYCFGIVDTIQQRLSEKKQEMNTSLRAEHGSNPLALVRVNNAIARLDQRDKSVAQWMKQNLKLGKGHAVGGMASDVSVTARQQGRRDGQSVRINSAKGSIGRGVVGQLT